MRYQSYARWARCRSAHCSTWAWNLNANMNFHRGISVAPLLRLASEPRPLQGFAEQRALIPCGSTRMLLGVEDDASGTISPQEIAALLSSIMSVENAMSNTFSEMLHLSVLGIFNGTCGLTTYTKSITASC
mmetsp:Transcript_44367/g.77960  ORF Transcript_44367/g.77960 Transcript_44367/m.77960 type:complete len:131 (+) Transcript_44367:64-456(+)